MNASKSTSHFIHLAAGALLRLRHAAGNRISVLSGCAWITQEGDSRDIVLHPGRNFLLDRHGLTIVQMLEAGEIRVDAVDPRPLARHGSIPAQTVRCRDAVPSGTMAVFTN